MTDGGPGALQPPRSSLVRVRIGQREYDAVAHPQCQTCTHPLRAEIEEKILAGHSYRAIAELYSDKEHDDGSGIIVLLPSVSKDSLHNHYRAGHMPLAAANLRALTERRAAELGAVYEQANERFVDYHTAAHTVLVRGTERLLGGEISPDVKDTLTAAKLLADIDAAQETSVDAEAWSQAMTVYFETARQFMPEEMWQRFTSSLASNPILAAIQRRLEAPPDAVDAEVVTDEEEH